MLMVALSLDLKADEWRCGAATFGRRRRAALLPSEPLGSSLGGSGARWWSGCKVEVRVLVYDPYVKRESVPSSAAAGGAWTSCCSKCRFRLGARRHASDPRPSLSERELALMKLTAYLPNNSRGHVVDELALKNALDNNRLGRCGD